MKKPTNQDYERQSWARKDHSGQFGPPPDRNLNAEKIAKAQFKWIYDHRRKQWGMRNYTPTMLDDMLHEGIVAAQEVLSTYAGRRALSKVGINLKASKAAQNAMHNFTRSPLRREWGSRAGLVGSAGQGEDPTWGFNSPLLPVGESRNTMHVDDETADHADGWTAQHRWIAEHGALDARHVAILRLWLNKYEGDVEGFIGSRNSPEEQATARQDLALAQKAFDAVEEAFAMDARAVAEFGNFVTTEYSRNVKELQDMRQLVCWILTPAQRRDPSVLKLFREVWGINVQI